MLNILEPSLFLVLDRRAAGNRSFLEVSRLAAEGGASLILLRMKEASRDEILKEARILSLLSRELSFPLIVSHHPEIALEARVAGCHLGKGDLSIPAVRKMIGVDKFIGYSSHSVDEMLWAESEGADYTFLGPIFETPSKLKYGPPLGPGIVQEAVSQAKRPIVFIGGINEFNLQSLVRLGARNVAVISAIQQSAEPGKAAKRLRTLLKVS